MTHDRLSGLQPADLIYPWDSKQPADPRFVTFAEDPSIEIFEETIRDGCQNPSITMPSVAERIELLGLMEGLGIHSVDYGLPVDGLDGANTVAISALLAEHVRAGWTHVPGLAIFQLAKHVDTVAALQDRHGIRLQGYGFLGSSRIRQQVEDWDLSRLVAQVVDAQQSARVLNVDLPFVTEDTTGSHPGDLEVLFNAAIQNGCKRLVLCDTCGRVGPRGVRNLMAWVINFLERNGYEDIEIDWHGHRDRGLALANALMALECGASRIHSCALGVGERSGNLETELLLANLALMGFWERELTGLQTYCQTASRILGVPITHSLPVIGGDAFKTGTGVHAAAIIKAAGNPELRDLVYSGVPAALVGRDHEIVVTPMSGRSNVRFFASQLGLEVPSDEACAAVISRAQQVGRMLTDDEVRSALSEHPAQA
ncbi:MAG: 2-isopropylmalate synthase [Deltaproteobacteria bacterium]|nr:2-isopropylmalate synthase [Deltaproteobacteria bacterium]